ncbi:hypothetical protein BJX70DRAFT_356632 [Aspergillus crustosus]
MPYSKEAHPLWVFLSLTLLKVLTSCLTIYSWRSCTWSQREVRSPSSILSSGFSRRSYLAQLFKGPREPLRSQ